MDNKNAQLDPDWCRVRETVLMLNLAVAQISGAMREGDESVNTLADSFTTMMQNVQAIAATAEGLPAGDEQAAMIRNCDTVTGQIQHTIVAFQFYDKLNQRLNHLSDSLAAFAELMGSEQRLHDPDAWQALQQEIKAKYTVDADKAMFDAILAGATVEEALRQSAQQQHQAEDDIELF
jgi:cob(I)alamin adenosyltransferase